MGRPRLSTRTTKGTTVRSRRQPDHPARREKRDQRRDHRHGAPVSRAGDEFAVAFVPFPASCQIWVVESQPSWLWLAVRRGSFAMRNPIRSLLNSFAVIDRHPRRLGMWSCISRQSTNCRRVPLKRSAAPEKTLCVRRAPEASLPPEGAACVFPAVGDPTDETSATGLDAAELSSPSLGVTFAAETESESPPNSEASPGAPDPLRGGGETGIEVE